MATKQLPLHEEHRRYGHMAVRHGWEVPTVFSSVDAEFEAAVSGCALYDASYRGRIAVGGKDALDLLQRLTTNDLHEFGSSKGIVRTTFTTEKGRVLDTATLMAGEGTLLITSPGAEETLLRWIDRYCITEEISLRPVTDETAMFLLIGPHALPIASSLFSVSLNPGRSANARDRTVWLAATEDTQDTKVILVTSSKEAVRVWTLLMEAGRGQGMLRMGFDACEAYRISRGIPGPGAELSSEFNPWEVGLGATINKTKGCYLGQEVVARLETYQKIRRRLTALVFPSFPVGSTLPIPLRKEGADVGLLTSVTHVPLHGKYLALGVVKGDMVSEGDPLSAQVDNTEYHGVALTPPILT